MLFRSPAPSPRFSAASPSSASPLTSFTPGSTARNSGGIESSVGLKVESNPIRPPFPVAATASSIIASFGFSTGIGASSRAHASMHGPKAEALKKALSKAAPGVAKPGLLSRERKALITEAMSHWAKGHEIYERLDPGLKARVHAIAERLAPK